MARVSFTLRRTDADLGSHLRYDPDVSGARTDYDSSLRADGLQISPQTFDQPFFEAVSVCYGEVSLRWGVSIVETPGPSPEVAGVVVSYSSLGEPQTVSSGSVLVDSSSDFEYEHQEVPAGKWAYYSLFVHYLSSGGDDYYERVASLSVLVPKNYGSNLQLWERIPEFYRLQDTLMGDSDYSPCIGNVPVGETVGPLFKFLSIIGFDMDRMRTMLDYTVAAKDPDVAHTEALDALADQMAVRMSASDLGASRLRSLMNDIGVFRRSKGTESGTQFYGKAIAGGDVEIDQAAGTVKVYSQRVNYITAPQDGTGIITTRAAHSAEATMPNDFSDPTYNAYTIHTKTGTVYTPNGTGSGAGVTHLMVHVSSPVPVKLNDRVGFSIHSGVGTDQIRWARVVDGVGTEMGFTDEVKVIENTPAFEVQVVDVATPSAFTNCYLEFLVDLQTPIDISSILAERNYLGNYFDGSTTRGGWLIDSSSISDYRWAGSANSSVSLFAEDYERTKGVVDSLLFEVFPITEADRYTIVEYNAVPGF